MISPAGAAPTAPGVSRPRVSKAPQPHSLSIASRKTLLRNTIASTAPTKTANPGPFISAVLRFQGRVVFTFVSDRYRRSLVTHKWHRNSVRPHDRCEAQPGMAIRSRQQHRTEIQLLKVFHQHDIGLCEFVLNIQNGSAIGRYCQPRTIWLL
jgi:hypothetical protein